MFYFTRTPAGSIHGITAGGFETAEAANACRDAVIVDFPGDAVGEVFESAGDPRSTEPRAFQRVTRDGVECDVWTDGTVTPVG